MEDIGAIAAPTLTSLGWRFLLVVCWNKHSEVVMNFVGRDASDVNRTLQSILGCFTT